MMVLRSNAGRQRRLFTYPLAIFLLLTTALAALTESPTQELEITGLKPDYHIGETAKVNVNVTGQVSGSFSVVLYLRLPTGLALIQTIGVETAQTVRPFTILFNSSLPAPYNYSLVAQQALTILDIQDFNLLPAVNATVTTSASSTTSTSVFPTATSATPVVAAPPAHSSTAASSSGSLSSTHRTSVAAIAVACVAIALLFLGILLLLCLRRRRRSRGGGDRDSRSTRPLHRLTQSMSTTAPPTTFNNSSRRPSALTTLVDRAVRRYHRDSKVLSPRHYRNGSDEPAYIPRDYKTHTLLSSFPSPPPRLFPASPPPPMPRLFPTSPPAPIIPAPLPLPDLGPERFVYTSDGEVLTALPPCTPPQMRFSPPPFGGWEAAFAGQAPRDRRSSSVGQRVSAWVYERRAQAQQAQASSPTARGPGGVTRWWGN